MSWELCWLTGDTLETGCAAWAAALAWAIDADAACASESCFIMSAIASALAASNAASSSTAGVVTSSCGILNCFIISAIWSLMSFATSVFWGASGIFGVERSSVAGVSCDMFSGLNWSIIFMNSGSFINSFTLATDVASCNLFLCSLRNIPINGIAVVSAVIP